MIIKKILAFMNPILNQMNVNIFFLLFIKLLNNLIHKMKFNLGKYFIHKIN